MKIPQEIRDAVCEEYIKEYSMGKIAKKFNISYSSVKKFVTESVNVKVMQEYCSRKNIDFPYTYKLQDILDDYVQNMSKQDIAKKYDLPFEEVRKVIRVQLQDNFDFFNAYLELDEQHSIIKEYYQELFPYLKEKSENTYLKQLTIAAKYMGKLNEKFQ